MFVGSFEPDDFFQFQTDVQSTITQFQQAGLTQLLIDLSNNGGTFAMPCTVIVPYTINPNEVLQAVSSALVISSMNS